MESVLVAVFLGAFVGWACPLFGRSPGIGTLAEMLIGAFGGLVGWALAQVVHVDPLWLAWLFAAILLAVVGWGRGRFTVTKPPAG
jgi:uncharacterized membrane protein YeaQ/YmgE (transglycosylase-associated protein family)